MASFRLTTKVQVSGWRFLLRRVEHAIVRRDTRMFDDPLQFYSRAVSAGIIIAVLVCLGAALLGVLQATRKAGRGHPSRRPQHQPALCGDARHRSAATGLQPDVGAPGARQRRHPGGGEVRRAEQDAQGPVDRDSGRAVRHPGRRCRAVDVDVVRHGRETRERRAHGGDVGDRAAVGARRLGRSDAPRPGCAGVVQGQRLAGHQRRQACQSTSPTVP